jgi:hypothetical protein
MPFRIPVISSVSVGFGVSAGADEAEGELGTNGSEELGNASDGEVMVPGDELAEFPIPDAPQPAVKEIKAHKHRVPNFLVTFVFTGYILLNKRLLHSPEEGGRSFIAYLIIKPRKSFSKKRCG